MVKSLEIDPTTGVGTSRFEGELGIEDLKRFARELWTDPDFHRPALLWDLRDVTFSVTSEELRALAEFMRARSVAQRPTRMAFVVSTDVNYGLLRMFEVFRQDDTVQLAAFRDHDEAMAWLTE